MSRTTSLATAIVIGATFFAGCSKSEGSGGAQLAPAASSLASAAPASAGARKFTVDKATSKVDFTMDAPQEKIRGHVPGAAEGELSIDLSDLKKTTGLVTVDVSGIELYQTKMGDDGKPGPEQKNELQNQHVRTWLEISPDTPDEVRKENSSVQLSITSIDNVSEANVTKMTGAERKVTVTATGDFRLHGRKTKKTVELEATFRFDGDKPVSVTIKTAKPFAVGLAEHDVKPREAFGKLAQKTLELLAPKVAKDAMVTVELTASLAP